MQHSITPIAYVESCFKEKFGIPRQPGLATAAQAWLNFIAPYYDAAAFIGLEQVSHLWLVFGFHGVTDQRWRPQVRPPRLGGNKRMGVFATRSTHRPNGLGLSVVKLERIEQDQQQVRLLISGADLLNGTPIYDIKPYLPYTDSVPEARNDIAPAPPELLAVRFTAEAEQFAYAYQSQQGVDLQLLITQVLAQDPAPAYHERGEGRSFGIKLLDVNVRWCYEAQHILVLGIESV